MKSKLTIRNVLGFVVAFMSLALAVTIVQHFRGGSPEELLEALPKNVDLSLKKLDYTETQAGVKRWNLLADSADHNVKANITRIHNVFMTFYDEKGTESGTLSAAQGEIHTDSRNVSARGEVTLKTAQGYTFLTDSLDYAESDRLVTTDDPIHVVGSRIELTGTGLQLHVDTYAYQVMSNVKARLQGDLKP